MIFYKIIYFLLHQFFIDSRYNRQNTHKSFLNTDVISGFKLSGKTRLIIFSLKRFSRKVSCSLKSLIVVFLEGYCYSLLRYFNAEVKSRIQYLTKAPAQTES